MSDRPPINFTRGVPAPESFPIEDLSAAAQTVLARYGTTILQYGKGAGFLPLREWLAEWQNTTVDRVMTANGSLQLVEFLCYHLLQPGDVALTESPSYDRVIKLFQRHKATVIGIPTYPDGPDIDVLEQVLAEHKPKVFYVIPDFQNPSGGTHSMEKRHNLLQLSEKHGFWLLEDAPYRHMRYRGENLPSLYDLNQDRVLHMLSFSKLISAGARLGIFYAPPEIITALSKIANDTYISPSMLTQGIIYQYCEEDHIPALVQKLRALYSPRLQACLDAVDEHLPDIKATRPEGGMFLSLTFPEGITTEQVREKATAYNLSLAPGTVFFPDGGGERFLRLPYCAITPEEINDGVHRIKLAMQDALKG